MTNAATPDTADGTQPVSLARFVGYLLWLGTVGFGGLIALAGHMQQDLVNSRRWISREDYVEGLALAQLAPGPLAAQLAIYLGYVRAGVLGATAPTIPACSFALATLLLLFRWKFPEPVLILGSAAIGLVLWHGK